MNKKIAKMLAALVLPGGLIVYGAYVLATWHKHHFTRPFMWKTADGTKIHYVVCTDCAKNFEYDVDTLKRGKELPRDWHSHIDARSRIARLGRALDEIEARRKEAHPDIRPADSNEDSNRR